MSNQKAVQRKEEKKEVRKSIERQYSLGKSSFNTLNKQCAHTNRATMERDRQEKKKTLQTKF